MIVEQRTYLFHPGGVPKFLLIYTDEVRALQIAKLGNMIGYFTCEIGPLNQTVHLWGYESFEERLKRRAELGTHELWRDFVGKLQPLLVSQESKLLLPHRLLADPLTGVDRPDRRRDIEYIEINTIKKMLDAEEAGVERVKAAGGWRILATVRR